MEGMAGRITALFLQTAANDYQDLLRDDCLAAARRRSFTPRIFAADGDADRQVGQIRECLREREATRPTLMLVSPVREGSLLNVARDAARQGIGWVQLNRWGDYLTELRKEFPHVPIFSVTPDQREVGRIQGQQFKTLLPHGGELVYIRGPLGTSSAQRRWAGMVPELEGTGIKIVSFNSDWSREGGELAMRSWLEIFQGKESANFVVGAQNDSMAMGARKALVDEAIRHRRPEIGVIPVTGCDGSPGYGQRLVTEGRLTATVVIPPVAGRAVDEVASFLDGGPLPAAEIVVAVTSWPALARLGRAAAK
jgi:ribose transport system substrate-binding protein